MRSEAGPGPPDDPFAAAAERLLAAGTPELDRAMGALLREAVVRFGADRAAVVLFGEGQSLALERSWSTPVTSPSAQPDTPWIRREIQAGRVIVLGSAEDLPAAATAERRLAAEGGICAGLFAPLVCSGHPVLGWAELVTVQRARRWTAEVVDDARRLGVLLAAAILRLRAERERDEQRDLLKQSEERLHALTGQILRVQDDERRRIARELHDGVAQHVFAASLEIARARRHAEDPVVTRSLDECEAICRTVLQDLRTVAHVLHPPMLDVAGLVPALDWYVRGFATRSGIDVTFGSEGLERLAPDTEVALFRVVQESLANVQRHSGSPSAQVSLAQSDGEVVLIIRDQGKGIELGLGSLVGVGVGGMRERLRQLGGRLEIRGGADGTEIRAIVPAKLPP